MRQHSRCKCERFAINFAARPHEITSNMLLPRRLLLSTLTLATCSINIQAAASDAVDSVTVTAKRTSETVSVGILGERSALEAPLSATGYTAAMILDQNARSTSEVLANDPSIRVQSAGDGNYDYFSLRGFSLAASAFSLDGLYGVLPWNTLSPEAVASFEVIRGPASTFTGASPFDNPGGTIDIQPKRANDAALTQFTAIQDVGGQWGGHADIGRRFGADGAWGVRVNAVYRDGELARDRQSEKTQLLTLGADYRGERLRASVDAGYQDLATDGTSYLFYIYEGTPVPNAPETDDNIFPEWSNSRSRDAYFAGRLEFDIAAAVTAYAAVGTRDHKSSILNPYTEIGDADGSLGVYPYQESYFADTHWSGEAGVRFTMTTGAIDHRWVVSASGVRFDVGWLGTYSDGFDALPYYASNLYAPAYPAAPDLSSTTDDGELQLKNRLTGVSIADTLSFADGKHQLTLGLRRQRFEIERVFEPDNNYDDSAWSPSVAFMTKLDEDLSLYANYMTGLSQGPFAPIGTENQNQPFAPRKTRQYEVGTKAEIGKLFTSLALFQITQPAGLTDPVTNVFSVNGEERHRGLEWTFAGEVATGGRVLGGINYIDAELTRTEGGLQDGNQAPGVPEWTANLGGEWDIPPLTGLTLTARALYTDKQFIYGDNIQSIPDWTRLDLGARYATFISDHAVTFRLNAINVTGENYWASAKGFGLSLGAARSAVFSASMTF